MKKGFQYGGILVLIGLILMTISFMIGGNKVFDLTTEREEKLYTFTAKEYDEVVFEERNSNLLVKTSDDENIHLKVYESDEQYYKIKEGESLEIEFQDNVNWQNNFLNINFYNSELYKSELYIPESMKSELKIENRNGDTKVEDLTVDALEIDGRNGKIEVINTTIRRDFSIDLDNGRIYAEKLKTENFEASNKNGKIELNTVEAINLKVENSNGKIETRDLHSSSIQLDNKNGKITFVNTFFDRLMEVETKNGKIEGDLSSRENDYRFNLKTKNGKIELNNRNVDNGSYGTGKKAINITTKNGSIELITK